MKRNKITFFIVFLIIAGLTYTAFFGLQIGKNYKIPSISGMRFGIDIRGGVEATYMPKDLGRAPTEVEMDQARAIMETRLDAQQILDRDLTVDKQNGIIIVRFPWKADETDFNPQKAIAELGETALLTFRDPDGNIVIEGKNVKKASPEYDTQNGHYVKLELDSEGTTRFAEATKRLINQRIGIFMDEDVVSAPTVQSEITGGSAIINGMETAENAKSLANKINSGSLPFSLESKSNNTISPSLGNGALNTMTKAAVLAFILICLFMLFYYRVPGFVACIALTLQIVGQILALSIPQITLTLSGIAGIILSIGMGVDANVIISERIKEELNNGRTLNASISSGFHRAFSSVFDGNITVMIVALVMMYFGSGPMLSFAYTLLTGVLLNFVAGVTASRLMISSLSAFNFLRNPSLYGKRRVKDND